MEVLLFYLFTAIVAFQFFYYIFILGKFSFKKPTALKHTQPPVSVIVYAKNNQDNIKKLFPKLLEQNYPNFEIVLVNDASNEEAVAVFEEFAKENQNIRIVNVANNEQFWGNKKYALTLGIKAASNNCLLFIENNCLPISRNWIAIMSSHFDAEKQIVLGYNTVQKQAGFANSLNKFDQFFKNLQLFAWAEKGFPFSGSNKNIAYTKETFFGVNGFVNHIKVKQGEAELFVNQTATNLNTVICSHNEGFTIENVSQNFKQWATAKKNEAKVFRHFKLKDKLKLFLFSFSQILFFVLAILVLVLQIQPKWTIGLLFFRYIFVGISLFKATEKLKEVGLLLIFPVYEIIIIFIQLNYIDHLILKKRKK